MPETKRCLFCGKPWENNFLFRNHSFSCGVTKGWKRDCTGSRQAGEGIGGPPLTYIVLLSWTFRGLGPIPHAQIIPSIDKFKSFVGWLLFFLGVITIQQWSSPCRSAMCELGMLLAPMSKIISRFSAARPWKQRVRWCQHLALGWERCRTRLDYLKQNSNVHPQNNMSLVLWVFNGLTKTL